MLFDNNSKPYEVPKTGYFVGVLADIVDVGEVLTAFGKKFQTRFVWLLDQNDSEGKPYQAVWQMSATLFAGPPESKLHGVVKAILGTAPPIPFDGEALIGKSSLLYIENIKTSKGKDFAKIISILPLMSGQKPMTIPAGYVRNQDKPKKTQPGPMAPVAATIPPLTTSNTAPPALAAQAVNLSAPSDNTSF